MSLKIGIDVKSRNPLHWVKYLNFMKADLPEAHGRSWCSSARLFLLRGFVSKIPKRVKTSAEYGMYEITIVIPVGQGAPASTIPYFRTIAFRAALKKSGVSIW